MRQETHLVSRMVRYAGYLLLHLASLDEEVVLHRGLLYFPPFSQHDLMSFLGMLEVSSRWANHRLHNLELRMSSVSNTVPGTTLLLTVCQDIILASQVRSFIFWFPVKWWSKKEVASLHATILLCHQRDTLDRGIGTLGLMLFVENDV
jgi:hypothetical protein